MLEDGCEGEISTHGKWGSDDNRAFVEVCGSNFSYSVVSHVKTAIVDIID